MPKLQATGGKQPIRSKYFRLLHFRKATRYRIQNALRVFNKILQKSMTTVRRQFTGNFLNQFFKKTTHNIRTLTMATKQQFGLNDSVKNETDHVERPSILLIGLNFLSRFLCLCVRFILIKRHGEHGPKMPPIDDLLLLESATSIAEKIRTKKVSDSSFF